MRREYWKPWAPRPHDSLPGVLLIPLFGWRDRKRAEVGQALLDAADLALIAECYWQLKGGYATGCRDGGTVRMHRVVCGVTDRQQWIDHINNHPLDNRRSNLRIVTPQQNAFNMRAKPGSSTFKGVHRSRRGRWVAQITRGGKVRHLGTFDSEVAAAEAYDCAAVELYGVYAHLNLKGDRR